MGCALKRNSPQIKMESIKNTGIKIEVPGRGYVAMDAMRISKAINEYDERLFFEYEPNGKAWVIFTKMPHGQPPYPICGFTDIPTVDEVVGWLNKNDSLKHGANKLWEIHEKSLRKERNRISSEVEEANIEMAEVLEHVARKAERTRYSKSYPKNYESEKKR